MVENYPQQIVERNNHHQIQQKQNQKFVVEEENLGVKKELDVHVLVQIDLHYGEVVV